MIDLAFYRDKTILVTGHTGFKGTWLCKVLLKAGAKVIGYSLKPPTNPSLFEMIHLDKKMVSIIGDIRDFDCLYKVFEDFQPEIVIHLAAQPIVLDSYNNPKYTYETNVMGTVNLFECIRFFSCVKSVLNVTTDKVYQNNELEHHYFVENDALDGLDPYSNSKSCSELVTHSYKSSFFNNRDIAVSTARAGNVIGGGDFANNRIIPDCFRAIKKGETIFVRNPDSIRPYQHVLEPIYVYLMILEKQYKNKEFQGYYNIGPEEYDCIRTGELVEKYCKYWGEGAKWEIKKTNSPHEANYLKLNCEKLKSTFNWSPKWHIDKSVKKTCEFNKMLLSFNNIEKEMEKEIEEFFGEE